MFLQERTLKFLIVFFVLFASFTLVSAEENSTLEEIDFAEILNLDFNITGQGINYTDYTETSSGEYGFSFSENNSFLEINGSKFENIKYDPENPGKIELDKDGEISLARFETNEVGGVYTIGGTTFEAPPNSKVYYNSKEGKIIVSSQKDSIISNEPLFGKGAKRIEFDATKGAITLPNGYVLERGSVTSDKTGSFYLSPGDEARINGVSIKDFCPEINSECPEKTNIFFDGKNVGENYISFEERRISSKSNLPISITFQPGNDYAKIEEGDKFYVLMRGGSFILNSNKNIGKIPEMKIFGEIDLENDGKALEVIQKRGVPEVNLLEISGNSGSSAPMKISFLDEKGNPLIPGGLSDIGRHEVLIDNFNRLAVIPENSEEEFYAKSEGVDTKFSARLRYNYVDEKELQILTGNKIKFEGGVKSFENELPEGEKSLMLGRVRDYWKTLTPETKYSLGGNIYLIETGEYIEKYHEEAGAFYSRADNSVYFRPDQLDFAMFRHELAHARHLGTGEMENFNSDWESIFESTFDFFTGDIYLDEGWKKQDSSGFPRGGFVRNYGLKNMKEHIATYLELLPTNPAFFKDLINPESEKYDSKYGEAINLLYKYKFISDQEYNKVLKEAELL